MCTLINVLEESFKLINVIDLLMCTLINVIEESFKCTLVNVI